MSACGNHLWATAWRWCKFSLVGAIGIGVQLGALALLTGCGLDYLPATALAVEAALLHNFLWHQRFTWGDRGGSAGDALARLGRFHLSTGMISILGNVALMRLLVGHWGLPPLPASLATIAACSLLNFLASDRLVFLPAWPEERSAVIAGVAAANGAQLPGRRWPSPINSTVRCEKGT